MKRFTVETRLRPIRIAFFMPPKGPPQGTGHFFGWFEVNCALGTDHTDCRNPCLANALVAPNRASLTSQQVPDFPPTVLPRSLGLYARHAAAGISVFKLGVTDNDGLGGDLVSIIAVGKSLFAPQTKRGADNPTSPRTTAGRDGVRAIHNPQRQRRTTQRSRSWTPVKIRGRCRR